MREVICVVNGLADASLDDLGGRTPLEVAKSPNLDRIIAKGLLQMNEPDPGYSGEAFYRMLVGENPPIPLPPGPLKAYAKGFRLKPGQSAFAVRFLGVGSGTVVDVSDELLSDPEGAAVCTALSRQFGSKGWHFIHLKGPRAVALINGVSDPQGDSDRPDINPIAIIGRPWLSQLPHSLQRHLDTIREMGAFLAAHEVSALRIDLEEEPVGGLLLDGGGQLSMGGLTKQLEHTYGLAASLETAAVLKMLGCGGMPFFAEQKKYQMLHATLANLHAMWKRYERIVLELPYLWASTYKGDLVEKVKTIEYLDKHCFGPLLEAEHSLKLVSYHNLDIRNGKPLQKL